MKLDATTSKAEGRAEFPRVSLKKDETARVCILSAKDWEVSVRHFVNGLGYVHCLASKFAKDELELLKLEEEGGDSEKCLLCKISGQENSPVSRPFRRFALRVLRYGTNPDGKMLPGPMKYWMEIWIISNDKYRQLKRIIEEWTELAKHDLTITCSDATYQKISIDVKKDAAWMTEKDAVIAYWKEERTKYKLDECLASSFTEENLRKRLANIARRTSTTSPVALEDESIFSKEKGTAFSSQGSADLFAEETEGKEVVEKIEEVKPDELSKADFIKDLGLDV